jgi:hypothetical protein
MFVIVGAVVYVGYADGHEIVTVVSKFVDWKFAHPEFPPVDAITILTVNEVEFVVILLLENPYVIGFGACVPKAFKVYPLVDVISDPAIYIRVAILFVVYFSGSVLVILKTGLTRVTVEPLRVVPSQSK